MGVKFGLLIFFMLIGNWACNARHLATSDPSGLDKDNQKVDLCTLCEEYSSLAVEYLSENKTQTEILDALHNACSQMHSLKQECDTLVDYYATLFFTQMSTLEPDEFCKKVNLCQKTRISLLPVKEEKCDACHHAVDEILVKLKDPDTKLEVIEILLKLCNIVDNSHVKKCKSMVFEYGPLILANAEKFIEKTDICSTIHACSSSIVLKEEMAKNLGTRPSGLLNMHSLLPFVLHPSPSLFFIFPVILLLHLPTTPLALELCSTDYCGYEPVKFPFILSNRNRSRRCGYPGFEVACFNNSQTILSLPFSGQFLVQGIDYSNQFVWISDPADCLPKRILNLNLTSSPFAGAYSRNYTFLNCSSKSNYSSDVSFQSSKINCLSDGNYSIFAASYYGSVEMLMRSGNCVVIETVPVPVWWSEFPYEYPSGWNPASKDLQLMWDVPRCGDCEMTGGSCGFTSDSGLEVGCSVDTSGKGGLPNGVKYGLLLGLGIPGMICMIGLTFYISGRIRGYNFRNRHRHFPSQNAEFSTSVFPQQAILMVGLDGPTIESYPKTVLGESKRLPKPSDGTCAICLSDYQPNETLRTIPECKHYFHVQCIDEWLQMRPTCPVCRNSPEKSSSSPVA